MIRLSDKPPPPKLVLGDKYRAEITDVYGWGSWCKRGEIITVKVVETDPESHKCLKQLGGSPRATLFVGLKPKVLCFPVVRLLEKL